MWDSLTRTPHIQHYWAWYVDINGGWPDRGNLVVSGRKELRGSYDTILEFGFGLTQPYKTGL
jgi:hypothetical protein